MALLSQLMYFGIRSVPGDHRDKHHIEFETPLTIISGPNGSGKTTLIEALKYVTANEAPPGDKQAFVHNLKVARSQRVDALIMLEFTTEKNKKVTVTKRFNAVANARNKGGIQFKSEEHNIKVKSEDGDIQTISSKNADFQTEVLNHLGVPAAILSNVIFCHQEDSCWPLSEPKELKQRFDKIFQLQKFTKAIDQAKKIRKDQASKLKVFHAEVRAYEVLLRNKGKALKDESDTSEQKGKIKKKLEELYTRIGELESDTQKLQEELSKIEKMKGDRNMHNTAINILSGNLDSLRKQNIEPFEGTLEQLMEADRLAQEQVNNEEQRQCITDLKTISKRTELALWAKQQCEYKLNDLIRKSQNYEEGQVSLKRQFNEIVQRFPSLNDKNMTPEQFAVILQDDKQQLEEAKIMHAKGRVRFQSEFEDVMARLTRARVDIENIDNNKLKFYNEISDIQDKLAAIDGSSKSELQINRRLEELTLMTQGLPFLNDSRCRDIQQEKVQNRGEIDVLRNQIAENAAVEKDIKERQRMMKEKDNALEKYNGIKEKHNYSIQKLFGTLTDGRWGTLVRNKKIEIDEEMKTIKYKITCIDCDLRNEKKIYDEKNQAEKELRNQIENIKENVYMKCSCDVDEVKEELTKVTQELKRSRKELAPLNTKSDLYDDWINKTTSTSCCPLCERKFTGKNGSQSLVDKLQNMTLALPDDISRITEKISKLEVKEATLSGAVAETELLERLQKTLEESIKRKRESSAQQHKFEEELIELRQQHTIIKENFDRITRIMDDISLLDDLFSTLEKLERDLNALPACEVSNAYKSSEEIMEMISEKERNLKILEEELDKFETLKQKKHEIDVEILQLKQELVKISEFSGQRTNLEEQLKKKHADIEQLEKDKERIMSRVPQLEEEVQATRSRRDLALEDFNCREQEGAAQIRTMEMYHTNYLNDKRKLEDNFVPREEIDRIKIELQSLEVEYNEWVLQKGKAEDNSAQYSKMIEKKNYITQQISLFKATESITEHRKKVEGLNIPSEETIKDMQDEFDRKMTQYKNDISKKSTFEGQLMELRKKHTEARKALISDELKNADVNLRNALLHKVVCESIIEDLDSFVNVLDSSILKFHKDKMMAINLILDDLWRKVYKGIDIETIKIKTEKNESADKRASYDYNVTMVLEGGIEVGMRDRCSAGQKMLASLLIRIALADVFAKTCSIIALDEPTTNLDTSKIEQMAIMLNTLINARRADDQYGNVHGKQFQMIVITHDERLVNALKLGCRPSRTFRISKDPLTGKSRLETFDYAGNKVN